MKLIKSILLLVIFSFVIIGCDLTTAITEPTSYQSVMIVNEDTQFGGKIYNLGEPTRHSIGAPDSKRRNVRMTVSEYGQLNTKIQIIDEGAGIMSPVANISFNERRNVVPTVVFHEGWGRSRVMYKGTSSNEDAGVTVTYNDPETGNTVEVEPTEKNGEFFFDLH